MRKHVEVRMEGRHVRQAAWGRIRRTVLPIHSPDSAISQMCDFGQIASTFPASVSFVCRMKEIGSYS